MKKIVFMLVPLLVTLLAFGPIGSFTVQGIVKDDGGRVIPFAIVTEKGTSNSVAADTQGIFTIRVKTEKATLIISAVGYTAKSIQVKGRSTIDVALQQMESHLEEVVVGGASNEPTTHLTNSIVISGLSGRVSGILVNNPFKGFPTNNGFRRFDTTDDFNTEEYEKINENPFLSSFGNPLSTFSIDVDAASYSNIRRFLTHGELPPPGAVRIEEMINYFHYDYSEPTGDEPFSVTTEISECPWNKDHRLALVALQGKKIPLQNQPASNLVFLIDVSGSMMTENKLPLVKASMKLLVDQLRQDDKVAIVVYAGNAGVVLPS